MDDGTLYADQIAEEIEAFGDSSCAVDLNIQYFQTKPFVDKKIHIEPEISPQNYKMMMKFSHTRRNIMRNKLRANLRMTNKRHIQSTIPNELTHHNTKHLT